MTVRGVAVPPLTSRLQLARALLVMVFALSAMLLAQLTLISRLQQKAAQQQLFDQFRSDLANGTAPIGPTDYNDKVVPSGAPIALFEIPAIGLKQVVVEGTASGTLFDGPGHRRDTPLPGQEGVSVVLGRRAAFGGPFAKISRLDPGDEITVTTGQGEFTFEVLGVRREGDPAPAALASGAARLLLVTADGPPFLPDGALRVDADLIGDAVVGPERLVDAESLPAREGIQGSDPRTLWALALWLLVAMALALGLSWAWHRWGRARTWAVFLPPLLFVGLAASGEVARLLPNLT
jgi:LPXTG-site transpeptidase (sortase) family protein